MPKTRLTAALCSSKNDSGPKATTCEMKPSPTVAPRSFRLPAHVSSSFDPFLSNDMCDTESESDEDLPDVQLSQQDCGTMPEKGDPVWVKYRQQNFWPALEANLAGCHRGTKLYIKYNKKKVIPFSQRRKEFEAEGRALPEENRKQFLDALNHVDDYVTKRALGHTAACRAFLGDTNSVEESALDENSEEQQIKEEQADGDQPQVSNSKVSCPADTTTSAKRKRLLTADERRDIRKERNQPIVDYICSEEMKDYLVQVYKGLAPSERHERFHRSVTEQNKLQGGLGPIDDDDQLDKVTDTLSGWLIEVSQLKIPNSNYLFGVWLPEAITKAIQKVRRCSKQRAAEVFNQGVRLAKCERMEIHKMMLSK